MNIATLASQLKSTQAALILSEENRLYFTGFASSNGTLLVMPEESTFITDSRYYEAACSAVTEARVLLQGQVYQQVFDLLQKHNCTEILVEADRMTLSELGTWRKMLPTYSFNVSNRLDTLANGIREIKCEEEVEKMQKAQDIAEKALEELLHMVKPGVAERDLANELEYLMRKFGADGISFDTIAVSGANSSKPHGVPGEKLIEAGDFLTIDFGALYDHYHSDTTRTFAVGQPTEEMVNVYETVRKAQQAGDMQFLCTNKKTSRKNRITHVAMATGQGLIVHARSEKYGVRVDDGELYSGKVCALTRYAPNAPLRKGMRGARVKALQEQLNAGGASLEVDGIYGKKTEEAVKTFRKEEKG